MVTEIFCVLNPKTLGTAGGVAGGEGAMAEALEVVVTVRIG